MREALAAAALLLALGVLAALRPAPARGLPPPIPAADCAPWMADAIPGVGPLGRDQASRRIRAGEVPAAAAGWFAGDASQRR